MTNNLIAKTLQVNRTWQLPARGRVGMLSLIAAESTIFGIFVVAYLFYLGKDLTGPKPKDVLEPPVLYTLCLLSSSVTIALAIKWLRRGSALNFGVAWLATILLGGVFLYGTAIEWGRLIRVQQLTISSNLFGTTYYSLVGLHGSHVIVGLALLSVVMLLVPLRAIKPYHAEHLEVLSLYWHFVDVVWVIVFTVVYVIGR